VAISVAWRLRVRQRADHARSGTARLAYLFKLRLTANVKRMIERLSTQREWRTPARLAGKRAYYARGWSRQRRVIILRRRVKATWRYLRMRRQASKHCLSSMLRRRRRLRIFRSRTSSTRTCEFRPAVSDRGDSENIFDELKTNGLGGFVTQDLLVADWPRA